MTPKYTFETFILFLIVFVISYFSMKLYIPYKIIPIKDTAATTITGITGLSYAALFFLMALPRMGFIKKIDQNGSLIFYGFIIGAPSLLGTLQLILASLGIAENLSLLLFFMTSFSFLLSITFTFLIMKQNKIIKKTIHTSVQD